MSAPATPPRRVHATPLAAGLVAFAAYAATAARTITWWDGSNYPLAAVTLGIAPPPGSLLLTILGWIVSRVPIVHPVAFRLNLFAALLAATLVGLITWLGARLATPEEREPGAAEWCAGAIAGLLYGFGVTPWTYATQFTPYGLSSLWTALILVAALAWWRRPARSNGHARLFVLFLLFGLDVSVHRTNSLLFPAALAWVVLRTPGSGSRLRDAAAAVSGLALGFAFHLLLIPMAARRPGYMVEDTSTLAGFWQYLTIEQKGGGFLFNIFPRTASFLSVQVADYAQFLARNLGALFFLPALLVVLGWLAIARDHPRRALGLLVFFLCAGPGAVIYFNLPHGYLRPIDRHYLPSLVILSPWIAVAVATAMRRVAKPGGVALAAALAGIAALPVGLAWWTNHRACDLSRMRFAETYARDSLEPLPPDAVLLTNGDNDSFPLWYMQRAEGVRRDVTVINLPLANTGACIGQLRREDLTLAHLLEGEPLPRVLGPRMVRDTLVTTVVEPRAGLGLPAGVVAPESISFSPPDTLYGEDQVVLDLFRLTRWRRPIYLAITLTPDHVTWLWPYARLDGLASRVIPSTDREVWDLDHLRTQLFERVSYADIADTTVMLGADMRPLFRNYQSALLQLARNQAGTGHLREAQDTLRFLEEHVPPERVGGGREEIDAYRTRLEAELAKLDATQATGR